MKLKEYLQSTDPDCMYFIGGRPAQDRAGVRRKNMKRKAISKLIGAGLTVAFFALVRPSSVPGMGITSAFSIVMYEVLSGFAHDIIEEHLEVADKIQKLSRKEE